MPDIVQRFADEVVPHPEVADWKADPSGLPAYLAKYHAARAQGFWLAMNHYAPMTDAESARKMTEATNRVLAEYRLAAIWWHLSLLHRLTVQEVQAQDLVADIALDVLSDLESAHVLGPNIAHFLVERGVDYQEIKAYMVEATP